MRLPTQKFLLRHHAKTAGIALDRFKASHLYPCPRTCHFKGAAPHLNIASDAGRGRQPRNPKDRQGFEYPIVEMDLDTSLVTCAASLYESPPQPGIDATIWIEFGRSCTCLLEEEKLPTLRPPHLILLRRSSRRQILLFRQ